MGKVAIFNIAGIRGTTPDGWHKYVRLEDFDAVMACLTAATDVLDQIAAQHSGEQWSTSRPDAMARLASSSANHVRTTLSALTAAKPGEDSQEAPGFTTSPNMDGETILLGGQLYTLRREA